MAQVSPEEDLQKQEENVIVEDSKSAISVLFLATKWQFDTYGLSTVNKSLVNNLRTTDSSGQKIKITCAVVEEDKNIKEDEKKDAEKYKVKLKGAKQPRGPKKKPARDWLDQSTGAYYLDLFIEDTFDFIIGHVPYLANGCFNFKDMYSHKDKKPKIVLFVHGLPKTAAGDIDDDSLLEWLGDSDVVFSLGKEMESEILSCIASLPPEQQPIHKLYIPAFPVELFNVRRGKVDANKVRGTQNVILMTGDRKDLEISGLDFPLAVASISRASKHILDFDSVKTNLALLSDNKEDKEEWKKEFSDLLGKEGSKRRSLNFQPDTPETLEKLKTYLRKGNLFILPLKPDSPLFGTEALSAVAAGVPILVSSHSGMASILETIAQNESVVQESSLESDEETWKDKVIRKLVKPEDSQRIANTLREQLLLDTKITQTHLDFARIICEASCVRIQVELDSDSVVDQEHISTAYKLGINLGDLRSPIEAENFALAFIRKLLQQRDKIDHGLLKEYCKSDIVAAWQEVLSALENSNRKLVAVQSGSLVLMLFCPTIDSAQQLNHKSWIESVTSTMENLMKKLGIEFRLRIHSPADVTLPPETELLPSLRKVKLHHKRTLGTMKQHNSEIMSEVSSGKSKLMEMSKDHNESRARETADIPAMTFHEKIKVEWPDSIDAVLYTAFSVSKSGSIGISSTQGKSLRIMFPGTTKPPLILPIDQKPLSTLFLTASDQEFLLATSNNRIHLWNLAKKSCTVVYTFREGNNCHLCAIDERTVACVDEQPSTDNFKEIHILNTDSEEWRLTSNHLVRMDNNSTGDLCYVKTTTDGTPCLLLNCLSARWVQCIEIIGAKVRWLLDEQQMGQSFRPWSICTDGSTLFIADLFMDGLYLVSIDDGSVLTSIRLHPLHIFLPSCVRLQGEYLYVGHMDEKRENYCISKFTKPVTN